MTMTLVALIFFFLLLSALFSGSEIAFIASSKLRVELKRKVGGRRGEIIAGFFDKPAQFIGTMLVGNNITLVIFTYLMTKLLTPLIEPFIKGEVWQLLLYTLLVTVVILIFGEFLPKNNFSHLRRQYLVLLGLPTSILAVAISGSFLVYDEIIQLVIKIRFKNTHRKG